MTERKPSKSSRRQRAAESLGDHLVDNESNSNRSEEGAADSWSSHDITGGVHKSRNSGERRRGGGSGSRSTSSRGLDSSSKSHNSVRSSGERSQRSGSSRRMEDSDSGIKHSYKGLSKIMDRGDEEEEDESMSRSSNSRRSKRASAKPPGRNTSRDGSDGAPSDKLSKILELGNQWKNMKEKHELASQQATSRRSDLTKEIF